MFSYKFYEILKKTFFTKHLVATASKNLLWPPAQFYLPHSLFLKSFILEPRALEVVQNIECIRSVSICKLFLRSQILHLVF